MSKLKDLTAVVRNATHKPTIVRFAQSVVTNREFFEPGSAYELPAGQAKDFINAKFCREVVDADELTFARNEIARRQTID